MEHVGALLNREPLQDNSTLVVDATGVGRPVVDMLYASGLNPIAVTITGGDSVHLTDGIWRVPKRDLVGLLQVLLQPSRQPSQPENNQPENNQPENNPENNLEARLKFAAGLPLVSALVQETLALRVKSRRPPTTPMAHGAKASTMIWSWPPPWRRGRARTSLK